MLGNYSCRRTNPDRLAILTDVALFYNEVLDRSGEQLVVKLPISPDIVRVCELQEIFFMKFVGCVADDFRVRGVEIKKPAARIGKSKPHGRVRESAPEPAFTSIAMPLKLPIGSPNSVAP